VSSSSLSCSARSARLLHAESLAALLAELEGDLLEQRGRLGVHERRRLVALGPFEARQPAQRAHALAQRREVVAERGHHAGAIGRVGGREREPDAVRAARRRSALDVEPGGREALHEVRADARRVRQRLEIEEVPGRGLVDELACERRSGAILPARPREQIERRRARAGISEQPQLARVEQGDLHRPPIQRGDAHDLPRGRGRVPFDRAPDEHVELRSERVVIGVPPRQQPVRAAEQRAGARARERAPLPLDRAERRQLAHHGDIDRHALRDVITPNERAPCCARVVAIGNVVRCAWRRRVA